MYASCLKWQDLYILASVFQVLSCSDLPSAHAEERMEIPRVPPLYAPAALSRALGVEVAANPEKI